MVDGCERRVLHGDRRHVFAVQRDPHKRRDSHMGRSQQETADIEAAVPPELQMPLSDSGSLMAKPRIGVACESDGQIVGHGGLRWRVQMAGVRQGKPAGRVKRRRR